VLAAARDTDSISPSRYKIYSDLMQELRNL
jgi:hypothetical protein